LKKEEFIPKTEEEIQSEFEKNSFVNMFVQFENIENNE